TLDTAADQLLVQNQTRFDGFSQTYFIGQQYARSVACNDLTGNVQLVRQQLDAWPRQAIDGRLPVSESRNERVITQGKMRMFVQLTSKQTVARRAELNKTIEFKLRDGQLRLVGSYAVVKQTALLLYNASDGDANAVMPTDFFPNLIDHATDRRVVHRISTPFTGGGKT